MIANPMVAAIVDAQNQEKSNSLYKVFNSDPGQSPQGVAVPNAMYDAYIGGGTTPTATTGGLRQTATTEPAALPFDYSKVANLDGPFYVSPENLASLADTDKEWLLYGGYADARLLGDQDIATIRQYIEPLEAQSRAEHDAKAALWSQRPDGFENYLTGGSFDRSAAPRDVRRWADQWAEQFAPRETGMDENGISYSNPIYSINTFDFDPTKEYTPLVNLDDPNDIATKFPQFVPKEEPCYDPEGCGWKPTTPLDTYMLGNIDSHRGYDTTQQWTQNAATGVRATLEQLYPGQDDLIDAAAAKSYMDHWNKFQKGYRVDSDPSAIVQGIAQYMPDGGASVSPEVVDKLRSHFDPAWKQARKALKSEKDAEDYDPMAAIAVTIIGAAIGLPQIGAAMLPAGAGAMATTAMGGAVVGGLGQALAGGDGDAILKGTALGGVSGGLSEFAPLKNFAPFGADAATLNSMARGSISGLATGTIAGDPAGGFISGGVTGGLNQVALQNLPKDVKWLAPVVSKTGTNLILGKPISAASVVGDLAKGFAPTKPATTNQGAQT